MGGGKSIGEKGRGRGFFKRGFFVKKTRPINEEKKEGRKQKEGPLSEEGEIIEPRKAKKTWRGKRGRILVNGGSYNERF